MRILVTGGTGFSGKALCKRLLDQNHDVVALDYKEGLKTEELRSWGADVRTGSVTDQAIVKDAMKGVQLVFHLAAAFREMNVPESHYHEVNVEGTRIVLDTAWQTGVKKFVYCSTCGVHGNVDHPPADESAPIQPADYYQRTKYEAEPIVQEYHRKGMQTVTIRPAAIYGEGDPERFLMIFRQVNKGWFPIFGNGRTLYHPLYIDNLVDSFMLCLKDGVGDGGTYLIADAKYLSIAELAKEVATAMGKTVKLVYLPVWPVVVTGYIVEAVCKPFGIVPPIFPRRVDWYRQNRAFDITAARRDLGYQPAVSLSEGLKRTANWYLKEGYLG